MTYTAWSDAGYYHETDSWGVSYVITNEENKIIAQLKGILAEKRISNSNDAEYFAFYLLLKKIKELNLKEICIHSDSRHTMENFLEGKKIRQRKPIPFYELITEELGAAFIQEYTPFVSWKTREFNLADKLLRDNESAEEINVNPEWFSPKKRKEKEKIEWNQFIQDHSLSDYVPIPKTPFEMEAKAFLQFHQTTKDMKGASIENTALLLSEKIRKSMIIREEHHDLYVRGMLHLYIVGSRIETFKLTKSEWTKEYKKVKHLLTEPKEWTQLKNCI